MSVIARFKLDEPDTLQATLTLKMTVAEWRKVGAALEKGKDGWYGPEQQFQNAINDVLKQADKTFYSQQPGEAA